MRRLALVLLVAFTALPAAGREIEGVHLPERYSLPGEPAPLVLNGAGVRSKFFIGVYVGALYLPAPERRAEAVLADPGPKSVHMVFLRAVGAGKITAAWREGFEANLAPAEFETLRARLAAFNALFPDVESGDRIRLDYRPGEGTALWINEERRGLIPGADFQRALLAVWLGDRPADAALKRALLGASD